MLSTGRIDLPLYSDLTLLMSLEHQAKSYLFDRILPGPASPLEIKLKDCIKTLDAKIRQEEDKIILKLNDLTNSTDHSETFKQFLTLLKAIRVFNKLKDNILARMTFNLESSTTLTRLTDDIQEFIRRNGDTFFAKVPLIPVKDKHFFHHLDPVPIFPHQRKAWLAERIKPDSHNSIISYYKANTVIKNFFILKPSIGDITVISFKFDGIVKQNDLKISYRTKEYLPPFFTASPAQYEISFPKKNREFCEDLPLFLQNFSESCFLGIQRPTHLSKKTLITSIHHGTLKDTNQNKKINLRPSQLREWQDQVLLGLLWGLRNMHQQHFFHRSIGLENTGMQADLPFLTEAEFGLSLQGMDNQDIAHKLRNQQFLLSSLCLTKDFELVKEKINNEISFDELHRRLEIPAMAFLILKLHTGSDTGKTLDSYYGSRKIDQKLYSLLKEMLDPSWEKRPHGTEVFALFCEFYRERYDLFPSLYDFAEYDCMEKILAAPEAWQNKGYCKQHEIYRASRALQLSSDDLYQMTFDESKYAQSLNLNQEEVLGNSGLSELNMEHYAQGIAFVKSKNLPDHCAKDLFLAYQLAAAIPNTLLDRFIDLQISPNWSTYVVRRDDWASSYNDCNQGLYGTFMEVAIYSAAEKLTNQMSLKETLDFFAIHRRAIGFRMGHPEASRYGKVRTHGKYTNCLGIYQRLGVKLWERFGHQQNSPKHYIVKEKMGDHLVQLSHYNMDEEKKICPMIFHTDQQLIEKVLAYLEGILFPQFMAEHRQESVVAKAGEIYWWLCQANPWSLGDPSIAEMLIRALCLYKGMPLAAWKPGVAPWEESCLEVSVQNFSQNFHLLFD